MVQKLSIVRIVDKTGLTRGRTFHLYNGMRRKVSGAGYYIRMSILHIQRYPPRIAGKRYRPVRRG